MLNIRIVTCTAYVLLEKPTVTQRRAESVCKAIKSNTHCPHFDIRWMSSFPRRHSPNFVRFLLVFGRHLSDYYRSLNPSIAMVFFKTYVAIGGGGKWPPRCISGSVPPRAKIPKAIPMFSGVSFSTVPMLTLSGDSFTPKFKMAPENRK